MCRSSSVEKRYDKVGRWECDDQRSTMPERLDWRQDFGVGSCKWKISDNLVSPGAREILDYKEPVRLARGGPLPRKVEAKNTFNGLLKGGA